MPTPHRIHAAESQHRQSGQCGWPVGNQPQSFHYSLPYRQISTSPPSTTYQSPCKNTGYAGDLDGLTKHDEQLPHLHGLTPSSLLSILSPLLPHRSQFLGEKTHHVSLMSSLYFYFADDAWKSICSPNRETPVRIPLSIGKLPTERSRVFLIPPL